MEPAELRRLVVRHRHVAPMLSVLLASTDARVHITDASGETVLDRASRSPVDDASTERHPILVEGVAVGWVEGPRPAAAIASVLSYACSRETDKRVLASEALDRYRELGLVYELAERIAASPDLESVAAAALEQVGQLPTGARGFLLLESPTPGRLTPHPPGIDGTFFTEQPTSVGLLGAVFAGEPEIVHDVAADPRAGELEIGVASLVAAPLRLEDGRLGVIGAASREPLAFTVRDLRLLNAIAALTAPAVRQAQRYEALAREERAAASSQESVRR